MRRFKNEIDPFNIHNKTCYIKHTTLLNVTATISDKSF